MLFFQQNKKTKNNKKQNMWVPQVPRSADPQFSYTEEYGKILKDFGNQPIKIQIVRKFLFKLSELIPD